jgi:thioredoxin 1
MVTVKRFTAAWCGPCKQLAPLMEQIKSELTDVNFETIDVDSNPDAALKYNIRSVPTLVIEVDGQEVKRTLGMQSKPTLVNLLNSLK